MDRKLIRVNSNTAGRTVTEKRICVGNLNGEPQYNTYAVIEGTRHMIRGSVMNGVHYNEECFDELASQLMKSNVRLAAPLAHPADADGKGVSAKDPIACAHNIGAYDTDWRVENGDLLVSNTYINLDMLKGREDAAWLSNKLAEQMPIDRSTGLLLNVSAKNGVAADGEPYQYDINEIIDLDHSAILNPDIEPGAKNNADGVGMFTNAAGECEMEDAFLVNAISAAKQLPVADKGTKWDAAAAVARIKEYTGSTDKPATNYRKFFAEFDAANVGSYEAYKMPFVDIIEGKPVVVPAALDEIEANASAEGKALVEHYRKKIEKPAANSLKKAFDTIKNALLGNDAADSYNKQDEITVTNKSKEDHAMRDEKIVKALKDAGKYQENMTDDQMTAEYEKLKGKSQSKANADEIAQAVNAAVTNALSEGLKPLQTEIESLKSQIAANADKEKSALVDVVVEHVNGMTKEMANKLDVDQLKALAGDAGEIAFNGVATNARKPEGLQIEMPESGEDY